VEKVLRKPKVIVEQDLVKREGENEGSWVLIRNTMAFQSPLVDILGIHVLSHFIIRSV